MLYIKIKGYYERFFHKTVFFFLIATLTTGKNSKRIYCFQEKMVHFNIRLFGNFNHWLSDWFDRKNFKRFFYTFGSLGPWFMVFRVTAGFLEFFGWFIPLMRSFLGDEINKHGVLIFQGSFSGNSVQERLLALS